MRLTAMGEGFFDFETLPRVLKSLCRPRFFCVKCVLRRNGEWNSPLQHRLRIDVDHDLRRRTPAGLDVGLAQ